MYTHVDTKRVKYIPTEILVHIINYQKSLNRYSNAVTSQDIRRYVVLTINAGMVQSLKAKKTVIKHE